MSPTIFCFACYYINTKKKKGKPQPVSEQCCLLSPCINTHKRNNNEQYNIDLQQIPNYMFILVSKTVTPGHSALSIPKEDDSVAFTGKLSGI